MKASSVSEASAERHADDRPSSLSASPRWQQEDILLEIEAALDDPGFSFHEPASSRTTRVLRSQSMLPDSRFGEIDSEAQVLHMDGSNELYESDIVGWPWIHENIYLSPNRPPSSILCFASEGANTRDATQTIQPYPERVIQLPDEAARKSSEDSSQDSVVTELATYAAMANSPAAYGSNHQPYWTSMSRRVDDAFGTKSSPSLCTLDDFVALYLQYFSPLWPLLSRQNLYIGSLHPLLFLVLTSIGAMYGGPSSVQYGTQMHNKLRSYLTVAFELDQDDGDLIWLAQARLLTQVAALYFNQPRAFSYSQQLCALIIAQTRRMNIYSATYRNRRLKQFGNLRGLNRDAERFKIWSDLEARRRLAFGTFRGDIYTSVLLGTMPLLSPEEIDLPFPTCDAMWRAEPMSVQACLHMIDHDRAPSANMLASDIFRVAMDPAETLPPLDPVAQELLIFGLQRPMWQFCHDPEVLTRLTGEDFDPQREICNSGGHPTSSKGEFSTTRQASLPLESQQIESSARKMSKLSAEYSDMLTALAKWESALPGAKTFASGRHDRSSLLSSLILFHLGYLRLHAPIDDLHRLQYRCIEQRPPDEYALKSISEWARSQSARRAVERACNIYTLLQREMQRDEQQRVRCNLLAFIGLHHGAAVLWVYAGAHADPRSQQPQLTFSTGGNEARNIPIVRSDMQIILSCFVDLLYRVSPGGWSSFAEATEKLSRCNFPILDG